MTYYYDLVISKQISENVRNYVTVERMSKADSELTQEEKYRILYKAIVDLDKNAEQAAVYSLIPKNQYNADNAIQLNSILNAFTYLGTKIELIQVANAVSPERDMGYCCYMKIEKDPQFNNCYKANLFSFTDDKATISEMEYELIDLVIASPEIKDIFNLNEISNYINANKKLNVPYYSEDLKLMLKSYGVEFEVVGDFND